MFPSFALPATYVCVTDVAAIDLPSARLVASAACATAPMPSGATSATAATRATAVTVCFQGILMNVLVLPPGRGLVHPRAAVPDGGSPMLMRSR